MIKNRSELRKIIYDLRTGRKGNIHFDVKTADINEDMLRQINKNIARGYNKAEAVRAVLMSNNKDPIENTGVTEAQFKKHVEKYNKQVNEGIQKGTISPVSIKPYDADKKRSSKERARAYAQMTGGPKRAQQRQSTALKYKVLESIEEFDGYLRSSGLDRKIADIFRSKVGAMSEMGIINAMKEMGGKQLIELFYSDAAKVNFRSTIRAFGISVNEFVDAGVSKADLMKMGASI